ncbi:MAG TPA: hypothetical protein VEP50_19220 [bacterium]|nr:hypothetical protein [bacterium]
MDATQWSDVLAGVTVVIRHLKDVFRPAVFTGPQFKRDFLPGLQRPKPRPLDVAVVSRFEHGWGFIECEAVGRNYFVHYSDIPLSNDVLRTSSIRPIQLRYFRRREGRHILDEERFDGGHV